MSAPHAEPQSERTQGWLSTVGWAAYLACSWTWCIGMFLPVLLVRDYGIWGFVAFAVPNVIGAAAMGWVLKDGASERITERHRAACAVFSIVTIAFQVYFLIYILSATAEAAPQWGAGDPPAALPWLLASGLTAATLGWLALGRGSRERVCAIAAWCASAVIAAYLLWRHELPTPSVPSVNSERQVGLMFLAPVCAFGFALCPYLDSTFLKAARQDHGTRRASFTFGFGALFLAMLVFTLGYSGPFARIASATSQWTDVPPVVLPVLAHMIIQLSFTVVVHAKEIVRNLARRRGALIAFVACVGLAIGAWAPASRAELWHGDLSGGETLYRCFMSFYGLLFPAYVWLCMIPTSDGHGGIEGPRGRRKLIVLAVACTLAAPCYWMGFIERVEWWLAPGLGIVLLSRLLVRVPAPGSRLNP